MKNKKSALKSAEPRLMEECPENWITWEFAEDKYGVSRYTLETLGIYPNICNTKKCMVKNLWERTGKKPSVKFRPCDKCDQVQCMCEIDKEHLGA